MRIVVANLQGELASLERMLVELEAETATLNQEEELHVSASPYAYNELQQLERSSPYRQVESGELYAFAAHEDANSHEGEGNIHSGASEDDGTGSEGEVDPEEQGVDVSHSQQWQTSNPQREPESPGNNTSSSVLEEDLKLSQVCYKSLSIGMHLAKKMDQVSCMR